MRACERARARAMLPMLGSCSVEHGGHSGTAAVAATFLVVFSLLLFFDFLVTCYAVWRTLSHSVKDHPDCVQAPVAA